MRSLLDILNDEISNNIHRIEKDVELFTSLGVTSNAQKAYLERCNNAMPVLREEKEDLEKRVADIRTELQEYIKILTRGE